MRILAPYSGRFKYNKTYFSNEKYKSPILILANIDWHYSVSTDEEYELCINNYDSLLKKKFNFFNDKTDCIIQNQPQCSLLEGSIELNYNSEQKANERCIHHKMELLAWYEPAYFYQSKNYGIHLIPDGIIHVADALRKECNNINLKISKRMAVVWATNLYCHELVHSWIEDIASLIEFSTGNDIYTKAQRLYNNYIFMEKALCNTAIYGLQLAFLERDKDEDFEKERKKQADNDGLSYIKDVDSEFDKEKMMQALSNFMRSQPKGYRDFIEIETNPNESFYFIRGLINLFKFIYQCDYRIEDDLFEAIDLYFGISIHRAKYNKNIKKDDIDFFENRSFSSIIYHSEPPVRLHCIMNKQKF